MARVRDVIGTGLAPATARAVVGTAGSVTAAGTAQATGTLLSLASNSVVTASGADSVVLPTTAQGSQIGDQIYVYTLSSTTCQVFPGGSETCNASTSAVTNAQSKLAIFVRTSSTNWGYVKTP